MLLPVLLKEKSKNINFLLSIYALKNFLRKQIFVFLLLFTLDDKMQTQKIVQNYYQVFSLNNMLKNKIIIYFIYIHTYFQRTINYSQNHQRKKNVEKLFNFFFISLIFIRTYFFYLFIYIYTFMLNSFQIHAFFKNPFIIQFLKKKQKKKFNEIYFPLYILEPKKEKRIKNCKAVKNSL